MQDEMLIEHAQPCITQRYVYVGLSRIKQAQRPETAHERVTWHEADAGTEWD